MFQLESTFDIKRYLSSSERSGLAASLQLTETQVSSEKKFFYLHLVVQLIGTVGWTIQKRTKYSSFHQGYLDLVLSKERLSNRLPYSITDKVAR